MLQETWKKTDGLPANYIQSILQTRDGLLWFISGDSLVCYDGQHFENFTPDKNITEGNFFIAFFQDEQGRIFIRTTNGKFIFFRGKYSFHKAEDIQDDSQNSFPEDKVADLKFPDHLNKEDISAVLADHQNNLWIGTQTKGLWTVRDGVFQKQEQPFFYHRFIRCLFEDNSGNIWVGTDKGLCYIFQPLTQQSKFIHNITGDNGLFESRVNAIVQDNKGTIFVGTEKGLNKLAVVSSVQLGGENILKNTCVLSLFVDREDNLWIGTRDSGLKCLRRTNFMTYSVEEDAPVNFFRNILVDSQGTVWAGSRYGKLFTFKDGRFDEFPIEPDIFDGTLFTMTEDSDGSLLIGTEYQGLFRLKNGRISPYKTEAGHVEGTIVGIFKDSRGRLWICRFEQDMGYYENGKYFQVFSQKDFPGKMLFRFFEDSRQNLWLAFLGGLLCFEKGDPDKYKMKHYLKSIPVSSIYEDEDGFFWLGSYDDGLFRFDPKISEHVLFTKEQGLKTENIYSIQEDDEGFLWMTTGEGIQRVSRLDLNSYIKGEIESYPCVLFGTADGLKSIECSIEHENSMAKNQKGQLLFATKNGIAVTHPETISLNEIAPSVLIHKVTINGKKTKFFSKSGIHFKMNSRQKLDIFFKAVTFTGTENIDYKYSLQGKNRSWDSEEPLQENSASFSTLDPGEYIFRVTAGNAHGFWNKEGAVLNFRVMPVFYQTLLFKIGVGALFLGGCYLLFIFITKKYAAQKNKYKKTRLTENIAGEYEKKLLYFLEEERIYRDNMLSIQHLADKLSIPSHHLSQIINNKFKKNFYELINSYRIDEAIEKLKADKNSREKILAIAYDVGFNNLGSFNRAFKRHTGKTPSDFRNSKSKPTVH